MLKIKELLTKHFIIAIFLIAIFLTVSPLSAQDNITDTPNALNEIQNSQQSSELTFSAIQAECDKGGDVVLKKGEYINDLGGKGIFLNKKTNLIGVEGTILNAGGNSNILTVEEEGCNISNIIFMNGKAISHGGAIFSLATNVYIKNCQFDANSAYIGGAVCSALGGETASNFIVENCVFTNNIASRSAGALGMFGNNSKIINCIFKDNMVYNEENDTFGGAIQVGVIGKHLKIDIYNSLFVNNSAKSKTGSLDTHGGVGCVRYGTNYYNCTFINNTANQGGALTLHSTATIHDCTFINNIALLFGGAISTGYEKIDNDVIVENCDFINNSATKGGAIQVLGENVVVNSSSFKNNYVTLDGGAICVEAKTIKFNNNKFEDNIANKNGGAINVLGNDTTIIDNQFSRNQAIPDIKKLNDGLGGAIFINSTYCIIKNNGFYYNTARNGSATYFDRNGENCIFLNNVMDHNQAWVYNLPINVNDIYFTDTEKIDVTIYGGNNIAKCGNYSLSNGIYNCANANKISIDDVCPIMGANSNKLYQDDREYNIATELIIEHEDGTVVYNKTLYSDIYGNYNVSLSNLKEGTYYVTANHYEDDFYKSISNTTSFKVISKIDNQVLKYTDENNFNYHDTVKWTLAIENNGPSVATGVKVKDLLPEGLIYHFSNATKGEYNNLTGIWTIGNLEVNEKVIIEIITTINKTGVIVNTANVSANEYDSNLTNNFDEQLITVNDSADLGVTKSVNCSNPNFGDCIVYTVNVVNNGPCVAKGVKVFDVLPEGLIFISNVLGNFNASSGTYNIGDLDIGDEFSFSYICKINSTGNILNTANVVGDSYDWNSSNDNSSVLVFVNDSADLAIFKSVNSSNPNFHDSVRWVIKVVNNGPSVARNVVVKDVLPDGLINLYSSGYDLSTHSWFVESLGVGNVAIFYVDSFINKTGDFTNFASVSTDTYDYDLSNNEDNESIKVNDSADLAIFKSVNSSNPNFHDSVRWVIKVVNNGPSVARNVVVKDVLPDGLINLYSSGYDLSTHSWFVESLGVGNVAMFYVDSFINKTGDFTNFASVSTDTYDYDLSNNEDNESIKVNDSADLSVTKSVEKYEFNTGEKIKYVIKVSNLGPNIADNIVVKEFLDSNLKVSSYSTTAGSYDMKTSKWTIDSLNVNEEEVLIIEAIATSEGTITNSILVSSSTYDFNLENNIDNVTVFIKDNLINPYVANDNVIEENSKKDVNIDNASVKMQPTGVPIIIFVIFVVLGSFVYRRK